MNRLHHLKKTLSVNIFDNNDYSNVEFILLDYNSTDGLEAFIETEMKEYLDSGKLIYYKTHSPKYFNRSHSRNLAFKLASGDLICNIDADNFAGKGFANYLNNEFRKDEHVFLTAIGSEQASQDVLGRICMKRNHFYELSGYDERMSWYGFEDRDFANRLESRCLKKVLMPEKYLNAIAHEQIERLSNEQISVDLISLYVCYLTPSSTDFLFLFKDGNCRRGTLVDNYCFSFKKPLNALKKSQMNYEYSIYNDAWTKGLWHKKDQNIVIKIDDNSGNLIFNQAENCFEVGEDDNKKKFYLLIEPELIEEAVMCFSQISNRVIMAENRLAGRIAINQNGFGRDTVYKNFNYSKPIVVS